MSVDRFVRLFVMLLAGIVLSSACSSSSVVARISPNPSPSPSPNAALMTQMCFTSPPSDWSDAMSNLVASLDGDNFVAEAVDEHDGLAIGEAFEASGTFVVTLNLSTGKVTNLSPANSRGVEWMSFVDGWLAWPQDGEGGSSIQLWSAGTHERRGIPTSGHAEGVVGRGHVAWIEPVGDQSSAMRAYDISSGKTTSLDSGKLGAPVFAGNYLVWTKVMPGAEQESFQFTDATTLDPVSPPAELSAVRGINQVAGSAERLVWLSAAGGSQWFVDDLAVGIIRAYATSAGNYLQFPHLVDPYLLWSGPGSDSIVDLRTGIAFDLPDIGRMTASGDTIVVERLSTLKGRNRTDVAVLHPSQLSRLGPCSS